MKKLVWPPHTKPLEDSQRFVATLEHAKEQAIMIQTIQAIWNQASL